MDARGLVAVIVTVHELAVLLAVLAGLAIAILGAVVVRNGSGARRVFTVAAFAVGGALITHAVASRLFQVSALDVEVVSLD